MTIPYVIMPEQDYNDICCAVRAKCGTDCTYTSSDLCAEIENLETGGSMEGFHKVQFFNDDRTTPIYTVFVPTGASAIYAGETPVSTVNSGYMFCGFDPVPTNVTADMDCYAIYETLETLDGTSWATISKLSENGEAQNYFSVGDTKMIHVEGKVGTLTLNRDYGVYIIGFDHNEALEGRGITFGTFKTASVNGVNIALCDTKYNTKATSGKYYNMNHWGEYNYGGWAGSDMRYDILGSTDVAPSGYGSAKTTSVIGYDATENCATNPVANTLMAALPADLRVVMKPMTIFTDNVGGSNNFNNASCVTASIDYLPLLSEYEVFGAEQYANQTEDLRMEQYAYFADGNSKVTYKHSSTGTAVFWSLRSVYRAYSENYAYVNNSGGESMGSVSMSRGIKPIFKV